MPQITELPAGIVQGRETVTIARLKLKRGLWKLNAINFVVINVYCAGNGLILGLVNEEGKNIYQQTTTAKNRRRQAENEIA